jgi:hypothetical protein
VAYESCFSVVAGQHQILTVKIPLCSSPFIARNGESRDIKAFPSKLSETAYFRERVENVVLGVGYRHIEGARLCSYYKRVLLSSCSCP